MCVNGKVSKHTAMKPCIIYKLCLQSIKTNGILTLRHLCASLWRAALLPWSYRNAFRIIELFSITFEPEVLIAAVIVIPYVWVCEWSTRQAEEQPWLRQTASKLQLNTYNHLESSRGRVSRWGHPLQGKHLKYLESFANQRLEISIADAVVLCSKTKWAAYLDGILRPHRHALILIIKIPHLGQDLRQHCILCGASNAKMFFK